MITYKTMLDLVKKRNTKLFILSTLIFVDLIGGLFYWFHWNFGRFIELPIVDTLIGSGIIGVLVSLYIRKVSVDVNGNTSISIAEQLDSKNDSISVWEKGCAYTSLNKSGLVSAMSCVFAGFTCTSSFKGRITIYDSGSKGGQVVCFDDASVSSNTQYTLSMPIILTVGCYVVIEGKATIQVLTRDISK